jgi:hypothetical protein
MQVVHCVALGNDELVYVCDRQGDRIQVFDKLGNFKKISGLKEDAAFPIVGEPNVYVAETDWGRRVQRFKPVD